MTGIEATTTPIPGMLVLRIPVHGDARGWFKENWQREKMLAVGLPDFGPVQNNISWNAERGATRGLHAEPWDKLVSVGSGRVFAGWVDLRDGDSFGRTAHLEIGPETVVYVPRGVANSYQALEDGTTYSYLVNAHWRPGIRYPAVHLGDPELAIPWPIPLERAELSEKDQTNPLLAEVTPVPPRKVLVTGAGGQLGRALAAAIPDAVATTRAELDVTDAAAVESWPWDEYDVVHNAAAFTAVDAAETPEGRRDAWRVNAQAAALLAAVARERNLTLVHYSTDYVFDGTSGAYREDDPIAPLGVYGQSKAAGEQAVKVAPRHYLLRTSWVVGDGANFVRTMQRLAADGVSPTVVADQVGRLTFTDELVRAARHLIDSAAPYGTYHVSNGGKPTSWADVAAEVFRHSGREPADVNPVTTAAFFADKPHAAPRPLDSMLDLSKLEATGFTPRDAFEMLREYIESSAG